MGAMEAALFTGWNSDLLLPHAQTFDVAHPAIVRAIAACDIGPDSGRRGAKGTRRDNSLNRRAGSSIQSAAFIRIAIPSSQTLSLVFYGT